MTRRLMLVALFVLMALPALAQDEVTTVITISVQQREGTHTSSSFTVAADAVGWIRLTANINAADYVDTANSLWLRLYRFDSATGTWRLIGGSRWVGGAQIDTDTGELNPMPWMQVHIEDFRGQQIRAELDVPNRMRVGGTVDTRLTGE